MVAEAKKEIADNTPSADYAGMSYAEVKQIYEETYGQPES